MKERGGHARPGQKSENRPNSKLARTTVYGGSKRRKKSRPKTHTFHERRAEWGWGPMAIDSVGEKQESMKRGGSRRGGDEGER